MEITGVQGNLLQLLASKDKSLLDFISTLKQGDILQGKVVDLFANDNRAIINFKGFNVISQLPQSNSITKGDLINVIVTQLSDKVLFKLLNFESNNTLIPPNETNLSNKISGEQLISLLDSIQVPINEQNAFIAQRLIDYQIPVTKENINDINNALNQYISNNSLSSNDNNFAIKQNIVLSLLNEAKQTNGQFNTETISNILSNNNLKDITFDIKNNNIFINIKNFNSSTISSFLNGTSDDINKSNTDQINSLASSNIQKLESNNNLNDKNENLKFDIKNNSFVNLENKMITDATNINDFKQTNNQNVTLENEAIENQFQYSDTKQNILYSLNNINQDKNAINIEKNELINNNILKEIQNTDLSSNIKSILTMDQENNQNNYLIQNALNQIDNNSKTIILNNLKINLNNSDLQIEINNSNNNLNTKIFDDLNSISSLKIQIKNDLININNNTHLFNNQNIKEILPFLNRINNNLNKLDNLIINSNINQQAEDDSFNSNITILNKSLTQLNDEINNNSSNFNAQKTLSNFINSVKSFISENEQINSNNSQNDITKIYNVIRSIGNIEQSIESIIFLKSRNLPIENAKFIDTMNNYFKNNIKLNQNLENLNIIINKMNQLKTNDNFISNIKETANQIKSLINNISLKTADNDLNQENITQQIKNFIDKSGLNIENKIKITLENSINNEPENGNIQNLFLNNAKENLKSNLIKLLNQINENSNSKQLTSEQKAAINQLKNEATNTLNNLNALQFINQKPESFDLTYAQIPFFIENKIFNGEIQIWYRKGTNKEDIKKTNNPINLVFLLNTSNLGNLKISLNVFKNDLQCLIKVDNEKSRQLLTKEKNHFINNLNDINFSIKSFNIDVDKEINVNENKNIINNEIKISSINVKA